VALVSNETFVAWRLSSTARDAFRDFSVTTLGRVVLVLAAVPVLAGTASVAFGTSLIAGGASDSVESELRFYAAFYVGFGLFLGSIARDIEHRGSELRIACGVLLLGALGRILGWIDGGRPEPTYVVLLAIELALPAILVPWQARVARTRG
jgi:hypothetical protein